MEMKLEGNNSNKKFKEMENAIKNISLVMDGMIKKAIMGIVFGQGKIKK